MNEILKNARAYRSDAIRRSVAHELSAEHHRRRGVRVGVGATAVSAVVGSTVVVTLMRTIGLDGGETISFPSAGWARAAVFAFGLLSIVAPILVGLQTYLDDPGQAAKHVLSSADYYRLRDRLDTFLSRYDGVDLDGARRDDALRETEELSMAMEVVRKNSIPLTAQAYRAADERLGSTLTAPP